RQAYVMAVVPPRSRAAAASVTNVPPSLAAALPPLLAGAMLSYSSIRWPPVFGGALQALYDRLPLLRLPAVSGRARGGIPGRRHPPDAQLTRNCHLAET